jgi:hypothetical protein
MLLESRLSPTTTILIDAEAVGSVDKGMLPADFHPDDALRHVATTAIAAAEALASVAAGAGAGAAEVELAFTVRIDGNAVVSIARNAGEGQFAVKVRWSPPAA